MECGGLATATTTSLDDLFSTQATEVDVGMEWLSIFVEDCFSNRGDFCLPAPTANQPTKNSTSNPKPSLHPPKPNNNNNNNNNNLSSSSLLRFSVTGKARSKRKRIAASKGSRASLSSWSHRRSPSTQYFPASDPPLLDQAYWMADSELIAPKGGSHRELEQEQRQHQEKEKSKVVMVKNKVAGMAEGGRRCSHCLSQRTPQWRAGPMGPKTLCNACGVRYKSGRLLPEYRPAKSPTFVSCFHSNSHKKVLEMRNGPEIGIKIGIENGIGGSGGGVVSSSIPAAAENR